MSQQTNPKSLRIRGAENWQSTGFYGKKFPRLLAEDFLIREFLKEKTEEAGLESIKIERSPGRINIILTCLRPGWLIGRGGAGVEELKRELKTKLDSQRKTGSVKKSSEIRIEIQEVPHPWASAALVGRAIAKQLEKRIPFRRAMKQALEKIMENKEIKGARIEVAGRLDGVEIARREWLKRGRLPRQTLRADIDYALSEAHCPYGKIGIKIWLYKGEKFE